MHAKRQKATRAQRIGTAIVCVLIIVIISIAHHHTGPGAAGGDPCAPAANAPQICEWQHKIDALHEASNREAREGDEALEAVSSRENNEAEGH